MIGYLSELERIGKSEINFTIGYFSDSIWLFKLGDDLNGYTWEKSFQSFREGMNGLIDAVISQFPDSDYVIFLHKRCSSVFNDLPMFQRR